jgi:hypothetical protein
VKNSNWIRAGNYLSSDARAALVRAVFEARSTAGFLDWWKNRSLPRDVVESHELREEICRLSFQVLEAKAWPEFQHAARNLSDAQLAVDLHGWLASGSAMQRQEQENNQERSGREM